MSAPPAQYAILFTADAERDVHSLDGSVRKLLRKVLEKKLALDPQGDGIPLRAQLTGYWKHRFAAHRVIYRIYDDRKIVVVCAVGARRGQHALDIYKQLLAVAQTGRLAAQIAAALKPKRY
ncbi:MAG TPA: type II toxin-antitoxin system RelE/ParE family toxin [Candidatus Acidoferrales bacterium]|nr:type II toxin-antitoxin system RelE/ParE family toxin [Candidatus Acidoferrales bacterium]